MRGAWSPSGFRDKSQAINVGGSYVLANWFAIISARFASMLQHDKINSTKAHSLYEKYRPIAKHASSSSSTKLRSRTDRIYYTAAAPQKTLEQ